MKRYFINDYGLLNAMGNDQQAVWQSWQKGESPGMQCSDEFRPGKPCTLGKVLADLPTLDGVEAKFRSRNNQLLAACYQQIQNEVQHIRQQVGAKRIGIVLGSSTSGIHNSEIALAEWLSTGERPDWYDFKQQEMGAGAEFLRLYSGLSGPAFTVSTACSSSANAFASARRLLDLDLCDAVIVGGADSLCQMTVQGFSALESVSDDRCQPFSENRSGINIGEAVALFVLSREARDKNNVELYGVGASSDAHHMSAPEPTGAGAITAISRALEQSSFTASDVDYMNLHGTATPLNDAMESGAVFSLFGDKLACTSSKSLTGHTLGAAAATELALCCLLLQAQTPIIPAQVWDGQFDEQLPAIDIVRQARAKPVRLCMSNSFAFGGNNASLIVGRQREYF